MKLPLLSWPVRVSLYVLLAMIVCRVVAENPRLRPAPTAAQALGDISWMSGANRAALTPDRAFFEPIRKPAVHDWLADHEEPGQTVEEYASYLPPLRPKRHQKTLCILPLGSFGKSAPPLEVLRDYCAAFFGMPTRILDAVPVEKVPAKQRINPSTQKRQFLTSEILRWLPSLKPDDSYALIAVTMEDLYPDEKWNFVFGQAMLMGGVGVFSFARYDPGFPLPAGVTQDEETQLLILTRSCKVLSHETGHMFGLAHCIFYECNLNGSNHLAETDSRPMHLCPVCLRKLQMNAGFDLQWREEALNRFFSLHGFKAEAEWTARRLEKMRAGR
jgi:archaemetzincin